LSDADDHVITELNHVTRQLLMEKVEPRTSDVLPLTLPPGGTDVRDDNLTRYHAFTRPGQYLLRGRYRHGQHDLWSAPQRLEITPAPLLAYDAQWGYHYGEKFLLHTAWMVTRPDGVAELFLRESARFRPEVVNYNPSLGEQHPSILPAVSFNRSLLAEGSVWVAWLGLGKVTAVRARDGQVVVGPIDNPLPLLNPEWASPPLTSRDEDVILAAVGVQPTRGRRVTMLRLDADGRQQARANVGPVLRGVGTVRGVCDVDGGFHLLWLDDQLQLIYMPVDLATLKPVAPPAPVWRGPGVTVGFFLPPVLTPDSFLSCLIARPDVGPTAFELVWLRLGDEGNPLKTRAVEIPHADGSLRCQGEMNEAGYPFILLSTAKELRYLHGGLMQSRVVASPEDLFPAGWERLIVNQRNDVFLVANRRPNGLSETLIHPGRVQDLSELEPPQ